MFLCYFYYTATGMGFSLLAAISAGVLEFFSVQRWREGYVTWVACFLWCHSWSSNQCEFCFQLM